MMDAGASKSTMGTSIWAQLQQEEEPQLSDHQLMAELQNRIAQTAKTEGSANLQQQLQQQQQQQQQQQGPSQYPLQPQQPQQQVQPQSQPEMTAELQRAANLLAQAFQTAPAPQEATATAQAQPAEIDTRLRDPIFTPEHIALALQMPPAPVGLSAPPVFSATPSSRAALLRRAQQGSAQRASSSSPYPSTRIVAPDAEVPPTMEEVQVQPLQPPESQLDFNEGTNSGTVG